jgi:t-SNARE complex subunit (syntaxin)
VGFDDYFLLDYSRRAIVETLIQLDSYKKTRILREIAELEECIQVIEHNIETGRYDPLHQSTLRDVHIQSIAELRKELDAL